MNKQIKLIGLYAVMSIAVIFSACNSNETDGTDETETTGTTAMVEETPVVEEVAPEVTVSPNDEMVNDIKMWIASGTGMKTITLNAISWEGEEISAEGRAQLDAIAALLEANPTLKVEIQGHTAKKGTKMEESAAKVASKTRALWTKGKLVIGHDAVAKNLTTKGYGSEKPMEGVDPSDESQKRITIELSK